MRTTIYCKRSAKGGLDFYINVKNDHIYLYSRDDFSRRLYNEYVGGQPLDYIFRGSRSYRSQNTRDRLIRTISYIEKQDGIVLLEKSARKSRGTDRGRDRCDEELYI